MNFREFFYFQKSDRQVLLVALAVAVLAFCLIFFLGGNRQSASLSENDSVATKPSVSEQNTEEYYYAVKTEESELFEFDPNTADSTQLLALGLQPWQVRNIYKYRAKGGIYRTPEDFAHVYGLTVGQYRRLAPYICIGEDYRPAADVYGRREYRHGGNHSGNDYRGSHDWHTGSGNYGNSGNSVEHPRDTLMYPIKLKAGEHIDLSTADTTMLKKVPGIGSYYARSIVRYREQLGGFYDEKQLLEIEGFPEEALPFFLISQQPQHRLNVNKLTLAQLRKHPYINFYQAKAIVEYRRLKGPLHSIADLRLLPDFSPEAIRRLEPYLEY